MKPLVARLFMLAFVALAACSEADQKTANGAVDDSLIYAQVEAKLGAIDANSAFHVAVAVHGGTVSLRGRTRSAAVADEFAKAAASVDGVKHVDAQLHPDSSLPSATQAARDFALAATVAANVAGQAGINALSVHVAAKGGVVTLRGTLKTAALRTTVVEAAKATPGVRTVVDRLRVAL